MDRLVFIHISDLHFGSKDTPTFARTLGRRPHYPHLASALNTAFVSIRAKLEVNRLRVLVSGDLSSGGATSEIQAALRFICERFQPYPNDPELLGLGVAPADVVMIAGNHDHWNNGVWPSTPGWNANLTAFQQLHAGGAPRIWQEGSIEVQVFAVDSASGFSGGGNNARARGAVSKEEFERLKNALAEAQSGPESVRLIICHHPAVYGSPDPGAKSYSEVLGKNQLDDYSRERLLELAIKHKVSAILTGHIHRNVPPYVHRRSLKGPLERLATEAVAQTTLQQPTKGSTNGFWLHTIANWPPMTWHIQRWQWAGDEFREAGVPEAVTIV